MGTCTFTRACVRSDIALMPNLFAGSAPSDHNSCAFPMLSAVDVPLDRTDGVRGIFAN